MAPGIVLALLGYGVAYWGVKIATHNAPWPLLYTLTRLGDDHFSGLANCGGPASSTVPQPPPVAQPAPKPAPKPGALQPDWVPQPSPTPSPTPGWRPNPRPFPWPLPFPFPGIGVPR